MATETASTSAVANHEGFEPYRAVSRAAVTSLILGLLSFLCLLFPTLLGLALLGLVFGLIGFKNIVRYPQEVSGKPVAFLGILLSGLMLFGGSAMHAYVYATEVPDGYERIAFESLKAPSRGPDVPPAEAVELDGRQIFIKGYIYPGQQRRNLKQFVLVPDLGTCCFGGKPRLTHMVEVTLKGPMRVNYSMTKRKLGGILKVTPDLKPVPGRPGVYYQLVADYAN